MTDLTGRSALVTGGASGIGAACARELAGRGARVTVADVNDVAAKELASEIGGDVWSVDLLDTTALDDLRLDVDILVNNAGIQTVAPIVDFDPGAFRRIQTLMVEAPFLLIRAALPHMYSRGFGRVVNLSSVHGLRASEFKVAYVTAKHALEGMSKVTALEGAAHGVTSNCVNPGYVRTPLVEKQIDRRPGQGTRHPRGRSTRKGPVDRGRHQATRRTRRSRLTGRLVDLRARRHGHRSVVHDGRWLVGSIVRAPRQWTTAHV